MTDFEFETDRIDGPHAGQPIVTRGAPADEAEAAMVLTHGRGATAESILDLADEFGRDELAYVAPQAAGNTWYPQAFTAPMESNEPHLSSALSVLGTVVEDLEAAGFGAEKVVLLGFSQGACLTTEWVARNARRYGGCVGFSGGLIGPDGTPREYDGSLSGTPVFLGCSDRDPHIAAERVHETADVLGDLGGDVTERLYEGMGHGIVQDELDHVGAMLDDLLES